MMTLANYGIKTKKHKDPVSAKALNESLQIRTRAESKLKQSLKTLHRLPDDKRQDILDAIVEYYSRVPFDVVIWNKAQVKQSVVDSILSLDYKFNPYKARGAFQIIESMLLNLHYLPWHKEFTKIVTYSGKFRLDISEPLIGAEDVLRAAGFKQESNDHPMHLVLPANLMPQVDGAEHVTHVIFDCMLAQVVMSDIITVLENSCKSVKIAPHQLATSNDVNCYMWIQSYFRERCHQVTDRACSSIQELLNNITNHLAKLRLNSATKTLTKNERPLDSQLNHTRIGETSQTARKELSDSQDLVQRQDHVRKLLAQKSLDNTNLLKLSDDLLKLPNQREARDLDISRLGSSAVSDLYRDIPYHDSDGIQNINVRSGATESIPLQSRNQPVRCVPRTRELDAIDYIGPRVGTSGESDYEHTGHPTRVDLPHNDRELLIPKRDRKFVPEHSNGIRQTGRNLNTSHDNRASNYALPGSAINVVNHPSRLLRYDEFPPIRSPITSQLSSQSSIRNSRYDHGAAHGKYEPRDADRPSYNRMHWSCGSCTFYNHPANDACEMCGFKKLM